MKKNVYLLIIALLTLTTGIAYAQNRDRNNDRNRNRDRQEVRATRRPTPVPVRPTPTPVRPAPPMRPTPPVVVPNYYYGQTIVALPYGYMPIRYDNRVYFYHRGVYYRQLPNRRYEVIHPYVGMMIPELPYYRTVRMNGRTYYAYDNYLYSRIRTPNGINFRVEMNF